MKPLPKSFYILVGLALLHGLIYLAWPSLALNSARRGVSGLAEIALILPPVLLLIALFDVWVPREVVERNLGPDSGLRGVGLALLLGTAAAGPLYAAFPIGLSLRNKGARLANLVIFLGAWGTLKAPMLLLESSFLGWRFALLRLSLTLPGLLAMGFLMEHWMKAVDTERLASREP